MTAPVAADWAGQSPGLRTDRRRERASSRTVLLGSATLFGLAVTLVSTTWGQRLDQQAMGFVAVDWRIRAQLVDGLDGLTPTNPAEMAIAMAVLLAVALVRRRGFDAVAVVALLATANLAAQLTKYVLARPDHGLGTLNSFPSGHVTAVTSLALALVLVVPRAWRTSAVFAGSVASMLVAVATVSARWHRPSDVIGALMLALSAGAAVLLVSAAIRNRSVRSPSSPESTPSDLTAGTGVRTWLLQLSAAPVTAALLFVLGVQPRAGHGVLVAEVVVLGIGLCCVAVIGVFSCLVGVEH